MYNFPIGVMTDSFKLPFEKAIKKAVAMGAKGVQTYCTKGDFAPENMTPPPVLS